MAPALASQNGYGGGSGGGRITGGDVTAAQAERPARADEGVAGGETEAERSSTPSSPSPLVADPSTMESTAPSPSDAPPVDIDPIRPGKDSNPQFADIPPPLDAPVFTYDPDIRTIEPLSTRVKPIVKYDTIYHFQNSDQLIDNPSSNVAYQERHNDYIADLMRRMSLRLWYGYGWASSRWGTPDSNKPMFGYFPVTDEDLKPRIIERDLKQFYVNFSNLAIIFGNTPLNINDHNYFDYMQPNRPAPLIFISDFGSGPYDGERYLFPELQNIACSEFRDRDDVPADTELSEEEERRGRLITPDRSEAIAGDDDIDARVADVREDLEEGFGIFSDAPPDIEINHWRRSVIEIKKFKRYTNLDPRFAAVDVAFDTLVEGAIIPFLNLEETYHFNPTLEECTGKQTIGIPKRYYDYTFQVPLADQQVSVDSNYPGYLSSIYEQTTEDLALIYEPVFPNIYIVDFASLGIEEYYKLVSLNNASPDFPDRLSEDYRVMMENFRYSDSDVYIRRWSNGIYTSLRDNPARLSKLAAEYQDLIFSNLFRKEMNAVSGRGSRNTQINATINFNIAFDNNVINPIFQNVGAAATAYDPVVHLASDTQIIAPKVPNSPLFASPVFDSPLGSEYMRRAVSHTNADTEPALLNKKQDFIYERNTVWSLQEWFRLYCVPEITNSDRDWSCFFRENPEQYPMIYHEPETWIYDPNSTKPVPVGADPGIDVPSFVIGDVGASIPPAILATPDGEQWGTCVGVENIINPLSDLYDKLNDKLTDVGFRSYREVVDGKLAYSEPLFYRLTRRPVLDVPEFADAIISQGEQNFILPANLLDQEGGFSYVDAQIHYGQEYEYTLRGYYLVVGNEYWYEQSEEIQKEPNVAEIVQDIIEETGPLTTSPIVGTISGLTPLAEATAEAEESGATTSPIVGTIDFVRPDESTAPEGIIFRDPAGRCYRYRDGRRRYLRACPDGMPEGEGAFLVEGDSDQQEDDNIIITAYPAPPGDVVTSDLTEDDIENILNPGYTLTVNNRPHLVLVETNIFSPDFPGLKVKVVDEPPLPPDVDIVPYRSVKDKVLHRVNGNVGEYTDKPKIIESGDYGRFKDIILAQGLEQRFLDNRPPTERDISVENIEEFDINFGTDDYPEQFEIFRIDFAPESYADFVRGKKITLDNTTRLTEAAVVERANWRDAVVVTSNSIVDDVIPNKKYWYTFRVRDVHDQMSNPAGILQFEMVDNGNSIFPIIQEYTFPKTEISYTMPMKKYIKISPSAIQDELNDTIRSAHDFLDDHPRLGEAARKGVWGKRYKLRVTSKLTGKKIDINFTFKQGRIDSDKLLSADDAEG